MRHLGMVHDKVLAHNLYFFSFPLAYISYISSCLLSQVVAYLPEEMQEALRKPTTSIKRKAEAEEAKRCVKTKI